MPFLSTFFISLLLTVLMIPVLSMLAQRLDIMDEPGERKVHTAPTPRCGGLAMAIGAFVPILCWYPNSSFSMYFLGAASIIVLFGMLDDIFALRPHWKFLGQVLAALIVITWGGVNINYLGKLLPDGMLLPPWLSLPLTLLIIVGVTNAVNLSDGLDGLAGGISLMCLCLLGYLAYMAGREEIALISLALVGAIFGFLRFNTHPAVIFMGDSGSQLLGFSAVTLSLALAQKVNAFSPLFILLLFGLPVLDTFAVITARISSGRSPFSPDRGHFHHKLLALGLYHPEVVFTYYMGQLSLVLLAFILRFQSDWLLLFAYLLFALLVLGFFHYTSRPGRQQQCVEALVRTRTLLKALRDRRVVQAFSFPLATWLFYCLILLSGLLSETFARNYALLPVMVGCLLLLSRRYRSVLTPGLMRMVFYLTIPFVVYFGDDNFLLTLGQRGDLFLNLIFILLLWTCIVVSFFSTRQQGFRSTPLDLLILLLVFLVPNLPGMSVYDQRLGLVALRCIIFYISFEVLVTEKRGDLNGLAGVMALSLFVFALKSIFF